VLQAVTSSGVYGTNTETVTVTTTTSFPSIQLHKVTFNETGESCGYGGIYYLDKWDVTLGNITIGQPSNVTLPLSGNGLASPIYKMISTITFTVPDGSYPFHVSSLISVAPYEGMVDVNGSDVVVQIEGPFCV